MTRWLSLRYDDDFPFDMMMTLSSKGQGIFPPLFTIEKTVIFLIIKEGKYVRS